MIHAMLSDRTARERYLRETPWADERQDFEACEARRVLAVAEPASLIGAPLRESGAYGFRGPYSFYYGGRDFRTNGGADWSTEARALAESLSAFLSAPDPADYLAAVSR